MGNPAEKLSRRQRLSDEIAAAAAQFANKIVGALIEFEHSERDVDEPKRPRRGVQRVPYVPLDEPPSTPEEIEEARRARRRMTG